MKVIGLTGGVGSGKSQVLKLLCEREGVSVIQADEVAHDLMEPGAAGYERLLEEFGTSYLGEDGKLNRERLAELIFRDAGARRRVDGIIHPLVWQVLEEEIHSSKDAFLFVEAALPDEKFRDICDEIWYVYTSEENRKRRLLESRGYTLEKSESIMESQPKEACFRELADQVIDNNGSVEDVKEQLEALFSGRAHG